MGRAPRTVKLSLSRKEAQYIDDILAMGLHGSTDAEVVRTFMRRGLQDAIRDGFLPRPPWRLEK
jgi:hypothetical protein